MATVQQHGTHFSNEDRDLFHREQDSGSSYLQCEDLPLGRIHDERSSWMPATGSLKGGRRKAQRMKRLVTRGRVIATATRRTRNAACLLKQ
eukprot:1147009-Pelagomonas_calceolata.AAC.7